LSTKRNGTGLRDPSCTDVHASLPMQHYFEPIERLQLHIDSFLPQFSVRSRKGFFGCVFGAGKLKLDADGHARERRRGVVPRRRRAAVCGRLRGAARGGVGDGRGARIGGVAWALGYRFWDCDNGFGTTAPRSTRRIPPPTKTTVTKTTVTVTRSCVMCCG
jgi:hypothetical protein